MKRIAVLLLVCLMLSGCGEKETEVLYQQIWESCPALRYGELAYDKLEILPWYGGRCEATGSAEWAETELGFYCVKNYQLYYADKANMSNWVLVCNQPDCKHEAEWSYGKPKCNAEIPFGTFVMREGRIWFLDTAQKYQELHSLDGYCIMLFSRAANGTDMRSEYYIKGTVEYGGGQSIARLNYDGLLYANRALNTDGTSTHRLFRVSREGESLITEITQEEPMHTLLDFGPLMEGYFYRDTLGGETPIFTDLLDGKMQTPYRFRDGQPEELDIMDHFKEWAYLSGDTLRITRKNDGLYDVDITTGDMVKVLDAPDVLAFNVMLPNCITAHRGTGSERTWELFDGESWRPVTMDPALQGEDVSVNLACVASDRLLVEVVWNPGSWEEQKYGIGQIMLDREALYLEYCGALGAVDS